MKKLAIKNGAVFLVPVNPTGFAVGVVIRADGRGRTVGAFFGPKVANASEVDVTQLSLKSALLICRFGDHGLHAKRWIEIGSIPDWSVAPWSIPKFSRRHDNPDLCYVTEYDDLLNLVEERALPVSEGKNFPSDAQYGSGVVEAMLAKLV